MTTKRPSIGIGVYIIKDGKLLLQKRKGAHGEDTWCPPGGHLEFGESIEDCAKRETEEEAGIKIDNIRFLAITNDIFKEENRHYITIAVAADYISGKVERNEEETSDMGWFSLESLPEPLFVPVKNLLDNNCYPKNWRENTGSVV